MKKTEKKSVIKSIKNAFKSTSSTLLEKCNEAIELEIAKDHHAEAKEIIELSSEELRQEFLKYHEEDKGNICCLVLDKAKRELIAEGKITLKEGDAFGHPFML